MTNTYGKNGGKPTADMYAQHAEWANAQNTKTFCAHCGWNHVGTAEDGRKQAAAHRAQNHPTLKQTRRRRGNLTRWLARDDGWQSAGVANAREVAAMLRRREEEAA
jgi:hypothetical protein